MVIELRGVEFVNKGAQLMLHAILTKVKEEIADAIFVMDKGSRTPPKKLREHNIYIKLNSHWYSKLGKCVPKPVRRRLGFVLDKEVNVVLDGSGFAFGDQWGANYAERRLGAKIIKWKEQGKKIILLPQAFGPFSEPALREVANKILFHSDLVFAREQQSYEYLKGTSKTNNFRLAPDFTNLVKGRVPADFDADKHRVAIVPNYKMIDKNDGKSEAYFNFLLMSVRTVSDSGLNPYFLIHEGKGDLEIAEKVNAALDNPLAIITNEDPVMVKGIIASAYFIICSRFHGIVSALSQGVPCIATSWSHKYEMLLREYDYEEGLIKELDNNQQTAEIIRRLADPAVNGAISRKLLLFSKIQKERSLKMWKTVFEAINK